MVVSVFRPARFGMGDAILSNHGREIERRFEVFTRHLTEQSGDIIMTALKPVFWKSQRYCPYDSGDLVASGYLDKVKAGRRGGYIVEMGYARNNKPFYAIYVHEKQAWHMPPTRWKFLQAAIEEESNEIQRRLQTGFRKASGL